MSILCLKYPTSIRNAPRGGPLRIQKLYFWIHISYLSNIHTKALGFAAAAAGSMERKTRSSKITAISSDFSGTPATATVAMYIYEAVAGQTVTLANSNANVLTATDTGSGRIGILTSTPTMELDVNGGVQGTVAYQSASDKRWKKNIAPLQNSLAKVLGSVTPDACG